MGSGGVASVRGSGGEAPSRCAVFSNFFSIIYQHLNKKTKILLLATVAYAGFSNGRGGVEGPENSKNLRIMKVRIKIFQPKP